MKKNLAFLCALVMSASVLAGCSTTGTGETEEKTTAKEGETTSAAQTDEGGDAAADFNGVTLKVLTHRTDRIEDGTLPETTKAFEEKYGCTVEYQAITDYAETVSTMMTTQNYGDVCMIVGTVKISDLPKYFEPLADYDTAKEKYNWAIEKSYDGTVYGLSTGGTVAGGLCYNKAVWEAAGVTVLPKTPDEFIAALKLIAEKTDAIPYYTNYKDASWTLCQWASLTNSASGDPYYENGLLESKGDIFAPGTAHYNVYKLMYDIFSDPALIEPDHSSTDWEAAKGAIGNGSIATMCMGSWAVSQFKEIAEANGDNPDDIGYMPCPISKDGVQYAQSASDYQMGINLNSPDVNKKLGKLYIDWYIEESGIAQKEGFVPTLKGAPMPDYLEAFNDCVLFVNDETPAELVGVWDEISKESEIGLWECDSNNFKIRMAEAAFKGEGAAKYDEIAAEVNEKWNVTRDKIMADKGL